MILINDTLLTAGVASLLQTRPDIEMICTTIEELAKTDLLSRIKPDVLILEDWMALKLLIDLEQFIKHDPSMRTIILNMERNRIQIFDQKIAQITHVEDFLEFLL